jgi:hypothetical protein
VAGAPEKLFHAKTQRRKEKQHTGQRLRRWLPITGGKTAGATAFRLDGQ